MALIKSSAGQSRTLSVGRNTQSTPLLGLVGDALPCIDDNSVPTLTDLQSLCTNTGSTVKQTRVCSENAARCPARLCLASYLKKRLVGTICQPPATLISLFWQVVLLLPGSLAASAGWAACAAAPLPSTSRSAPSSSAILHGRVGAAQLAAAPSAGTQTPSVFIAFAYRFTRRYIDSDILQNIERSMKSNPIYKRKQTLPTT